MGKSLSIQEQSRLLFFVSFFSLFLTLYLLLHPSHLSRTCTVKSSSSVLIPIHRPLFSYPSSYGEHKYAIPTFHSSCDNFLRFTDYRLVFRGIQDSLRNSSMHERVEELRYISGSGTHMFSGNFSTKERKSFFSFNGGEIPCGFMKEFRVRKSDRIAMESCRGIVVVSAIFGNHDKIRQPRGLASKSLETTCFFMFIDHRTMEGLNSHNIILNETEESRIGVWRVVKVLELPYDSPAMNGVIVKHLIHRLFSNSLYSIWVDAKLQLTVDPLLLLHSLLISEDANMAISKHPFNIHTMEEAVATARWKKWEDIQSLQEQMEAYCENGLQPWSRKKRPYTTDVPDTGLILRKHGIGSNLFSCLLFNELEAFNPRDQLSFAYVRDLMNPKIKINMFEVEVFEQIAVEYRHNIKKNFDTAPRNVKTEMGSTMDIIGGKCESYLKKMWEDSHDERSTEQ